MNQMTKYPSRRGFIGVALSFVLASSLMALFLIAVESAFAADPADLSIEKQGTEADTLFMDHNGWCGGEGPDGLWVPYAIRNDGTDTMTGLQTSLTLPSPLVNDDPVRFVGTLGPGEEMIVYYYVDYSALRAAPCTNIPAYSEAYTITVTSIDGSLSGPGGEDSAEFSSTFDSVGIQEASAGGEVITEVLGPGIALGQVFTFTVDYSLQNQANRPAFFQPSGNGTFDDSCFRLIGSEVTNVVNVSAGINVGDMDLLYFENVSTGGGQPGPSVTIEYQFIALCDPNAETVTQAWAAQISGGPWKYLEANFQDPGVTFPDPVSGVVTIDKGVEVPPSWLFGDPLIVTYTVRFTNSYTEAILVNTVTDQPDPDIVFGGHAPISAISPANSSISPANGDTDTLDWVGIPPDSSYIIPAEGTSDLVYTATIEYDIFDLNLQVFTNTVTATVGTEVLGPVSRTVRVDPGGVTAVGLNLLAASQFSGQVGWMATAFALLALLTAALIVWPRNRNVN